MSQWLRALVVFAMDPALILSTYMVAHKGDIMPSSVFDEYCTHTVHIHIRSQTLTHIKCKETKDF